MNYWDMFVSEFYSTLPVWFIGTLMLGWWLGWKACELIRFGEIKMRMHERRILHHIRQMEKRSMAVPDPVARAFAGVPVKKEEVNMRGGPGVQLDSSPG